MTNKEKAREIADKNYNEYSMSGGQYLISKNECVKSALEMANWNNWQAKKAFCLACCEGKPSRDTCTSLGTCEAYDRFCKYLRKGI